MAEKKYLSLEGLQEYDSLLKEKIAESSEASVLYAKEYADSVASGKSDSSHTHDDVYYTESEVDELLSGKSDSSHNHDDKYDAIGSANQALDIAKNYTDIVVASKIFIGTYAKYEAANANGDIPINAIVIITDDNGAVNAGATSSLLGTGKLGYMILA